MKFFNSIRDALPANRTDGRKSDVEFTVNDRKYLAEVKFDKRADDTGNIAVEYENPRTGQPTGLLSSDSDLWAIVLTSGAIWVSRTVDFVGFFRDTPGKDMRFVGDGNSSCRLYKKEVLLGPVFTRMDDLHPFEISMLFLDYFEDCDSEVSRDNFIERGGDERF